jgi:hypothetical protein
MRQARIVWDAKQQVWFVVKGRRYVRSFPTLLAAERWLTRGDCPDFVEEPT